MTTVDPGIFFPINFYKFAQFGRVYELRIASTIILVLIFLSAMLFPSVYVRPARGIAPDFSLSADQSSLSVKESYTIYINNVPESKYYGANDNLLLTSLNGFSGTISLTYSAASSIDFGFTTRHFKQYSVTLSSNSSIQVAAGFYAYATGNYNLTITGTTGSIVHSITLPVTVLPSPDFSIAASPSSVRLLPGSSAGSTFTVSSVNGYSGLVSISICVNQGCVGSPVPVTATTSPTSVSLTSGGSASTTINVTALSNAATGDYIVNMFGSGGGVTNGAATIDALVGPYFDLTANPSRFSVPKGSAGTSTITLTSHVPYAFNATLQASVAVPLTLCNPTCPVPPTVSISPSTVLLPAFGTATTVLTVSTNATTMAGATIAVSGGGCNCNLPSITVQLIVADPPGQSLTLDGVNVAITPSLTVSGNTVSGTVSVTVTNATSGSTIFSKTFTVSFSFSSGQTPQFVLVMPSTVGALGASCLTNPSSDQTSCIVSKDPDINLDGAVDISDLAILALAWNRVPGSPNWNPSLDLNGDGRIGILDLAIVAINWKVPMFA